MRARPTVLYYSPAQHAAAALPRSWIDGRGYPLIPLRDRVAVEPPARRNLPVLIVVDGDGAGAEATALCRELKADSYTAIVPVVLVSARHAADQVRAWFDAGADEVITPLFEPSEQSGRLDALLRGEGEQSRYVPLSTQPELLLLHSCCRE